MTPGPKRRRLRCTPEAEAGRKETGGRTGGWEHHLWAEDDPPPSLLPLLKVYKAAGKLFLRQFIPDRLPVSSMAHLPLFPFSFLPHDLPRGLTGRTRLGCRDVGPKSRNTALLTRDVECAPSPFPLHDPLPRGLTGRARLG